MCAPSNKLNFLANDAQDCFAHNATKCLTNANGANSGFFANGMRRQAMNSFRMAGSM